MAARHISKYTLRDKLGEGGMGVVYKAEDTQLKRTVALKFLNPDAFGSDEDKQRFIREAQIGASLDHPNICTVYEIDERDDEVFIAVAYIEGVSLDVKVQSGPLDIAEAVQIATQVARGLSAAHDKGIVHRDIKSSNILLTNDGLVKITDFGLAKLVGDGEMSGRIIAGSTAYMSPEQARADEVDLRTDIWSLGVVLFEMLTGVLPFRGDFEAALMYSILNEEPRHITGLRPAVPVDLKRVINKMLAKNPDDRFQTAEEARAALAEVKRVLEDSGVKPPTGGKPSIAVLPFVDMSPDGDQEYFCDGIAEEITSALTKLEGLRVVARTSAFSFKGKNVGIPDIGLRLGVETLLEGSVRKAGNKLRIAVQLTSAKDGYDLWSEQYDREFEDIFAIQDEIRLAIVDQMKVTLLHEDRAALVKRHTVDPEAYSLYLRGRFFWSKRTEDGYRKALDYFKQAIAKDPSYALAYVGIADCYDLLGWYDYLAPDEAFPKARAAAHKAMEMDERLAEAHATAGWICANYDWSWGCAESNYKQALKLNPGYATAHQWYAEYLSYMGRHEEAIKHAEEAVQLDPLSIIINCDLGQVLYYAREYDRAIEQLGRTLEMEPGFSISHYFLAFAYLQRRNHTGALQAAQKALVLSGGEGPLNVAQLGLVHAFAGNADEARAALATLSELSDKRYVSPFSVALVHMGLGQIDEAFEWLNKAHEARDHWLETLKVHPVLDTLRMDPQYEGLLAKMQLEV